MQKPVLGRGLGSLMGQKKETAASPEAGGEPKQLSPGLGAFLRGGNGASSPEPPPEDTKNPFTSSERAKRPVGDDPNGADSLDELKAKEARRSNRVLRISLVTADLLLVCLAARLVLRAHGKVGFPEIALCVLALGMGAWLACTAILRK